MTNCLSAASAIHGKRRVQIITAADDQPYASAVALHSEGGNRHV